MKLAPILTDRAADFVKPIKADFVAGAAVVPYSEKLEQGFAFETRFGDPVNMSLRRGPSLYVPRRLVTSSGQDHRSDGVPFSFDAKIKPRNEDQERVFTEAGKLVLAEKSFLVEAPTGWGKTVLGAELIAWRDRRALVVVPKEDSLDEWRESMIKFLGLSPKQVGRWQGDKLPTSDQPVVIGMLQSLAKEARYPSWLYRTFGTVIFDEVHRLGADEFSKACFWLPARVRVGLSASAERRDGKDVVFHSHIGPVRVRAQMEQMVPRVLLIETGYSPPAQKQDVNGVSTYRPAEPTPGKTTWVDQHMAKHWGRNAIIAKAVKQCYDKGRLTIVFTRTLDHLDALEDGLYRLGVPHGDMGRYIGGMKKHEYEESKAKPIILATLAMAGESTNIPWLDTVAICTPLTDPRQPVGRIRREYEGKSDPLVLDFRDDQSKVWRNWGYKRESFYKSLGCAIGHASV